METLHADPAAAGPMSWGLGWKHPSETFHPALDYGDFPIPYSDTPLTDLRPGSHSDLCPGDHPDLLNRSHLSLPHPRPSSPTSAQAANPTSAQAANPTSARVPPRPPPQQPPRPRILSLPNLKPPLSFSSCSPPCAHSLDRRTGTTSSQHQGPAGEGLDLREGQYPRIMCPAGARNSSSPSRIPLCSTSGLKYPKSPVEQNITEFEQWLEITVQTRKAFCRRNSWIISAGLENSTKWRPMW